MRTPLALTLALSLAACAADEADPAAAPEAVAAAPVADDLTADDMTDSEAEAIVDAVTAEPRTAYRIDSAVAGDRACYLDVTNDATGAAESLMADFEVCYQIEDDGLAGRLVAVETETAEIMADSCEGDIDCPDRDTVDLVTAIDLLD